MCPRTAVKGNVGSRAFIRRTRGLRRGKWPKELFIVLLIFVFVCIICWPNLRVDKAEQLTNIINPPTVSYSEFISLALRSLAQNINEGKPPGAQGERCRVYRCALLTPRMTAACAALLVDGIPMDSSDTARQANEQSCGVLLPPDQPNSVRLCRLNNEERTTNGQMGFYAGTEENILKSIPRQVEKMRQKAEAHSMNSPLLPDLLEAVSAADERHDLTNSDAFCNSIPQLQPNEKSYVGDTEGVTSDVQVLSTAYLFLHTPNIDALDERLSSIMCSSPITYLMWDHTYLLPMNRTTQLLRPFILKLVEFIEQNCEMKMMKSVYEEKGSSQSSFQVMRVRCSTTQLLEWSEVKKISRWHSLNAEDVRLIKHNHASHQPLLCENFGHALTLSEVVKFGKKTAVFMGTWKGKEVLVKLFHPYQYFSFVGFRKFMEKSTVRSPLIHYPSFSCYSSTYEAIFQVQRFLDEFHTLQSVVTSSKKSNALPLVARVEIAIQIVCLFYFLHEQNPAGFFVYDDNHPSQYLLKKLPDSSYIVRLIDIDTLQIGIQDSTTGDKAKISVAYPYGNITTHCRCFYCRGRSSCQFFNTQESYEACGQVSEPKAWRHEFPHLIDPRRQCNGSSDMWFEAQLLYFLFMGKIAWQTKDRNALLESIRRKAMPSLKKRKGENKAWKSIRELLSQMLLDRPSEEKVLQSLLDICTQMGCLQASCPAVYSLHDALYSSPAALPLG